MFFDQDLIDHVQTRNTIEVDSLIIAEWNQNILSNIQDYGNYRLRVGESDARYLAIQPSYDPSDTALAYNGATESKIISEYRTDSEEPLIFEEDEVERYLQYSLKDCFKPFRPRSGINKMLYFDGDYVDSLRSSRRPRYYFSSRKDNFKYWNSFRKESGIERGVSSLRPDNAGGYVIKDCAPFVVYKDEVATNRIVVKMQTNISDPTAVGIDGESLASEYIRTPDGEYRLDPLSDTANSTIPHTWKIQYLDPLNNWITAASFNSDSTRSNGTAIVPWDGYVELSYGIKIPEEYRDNFNFINYVSSSVQMPLTPNISGEAYVVGADRQRIGTLLVGNMTTGTWDQHTLEYGFSLNEDDDTKKTGIINSLIDPEYFTLGGIDTFREIVFVKGLRVVVEKMFASEKTFNLIEMSPRLKANVSNYTVSFEINKAIAATDYGLPVGGLLASNGTVELSNHDNSFTESNAYNSETKTGSLIASLMQPQVKFDFYETFLNVNGYDKFIPLKTYYTEDFPLATDGLNNLSINLRDAFFRLETSTCTPIFLRNLTLTAAVAMLLDNIGFSNYIYKDIYNSNDPVIPFFFVEPDISVAEVLQRLAVATQCAMYFDEYNNFVVMPKEYLMPDISVSESDPSISDRLTTLYGQKTDDIMPNIVSISGTETKVINDGQINYVTRYIQREVSKLEQAQYALQDRTYGYKPTLLWEIGDQEESRTINQQVGTAGYSLGAAPLNTSLPSVAPFVENNQIKNNTIDVGENATWLPRFQGYLYANGEIIRYDAQEYSVGLRRNSSGVVQESNVWIKNNNEYQKYFSKLSFNGKIYPTGKIRIFCEPYYESNDSADVEDLEQGVVYKNGPVKAHGRAQFGTNITSHPAGLDAYWTTASNRKAFRMESGLLFNTYPTYSIQYPPAIARTPNVGLGEDTTAASQASVTGITTNFLRKYYYNEGTLRTNTPTQTGSIQSSALILSGPKPITNPPSDLSTTTTRDLVSYVYKDLSKDFKHVGTRLRIIGRPEVNGQQVPQNAVDYYTVTSQSGTSRIAGGSGGIGYMLNKDNNSGYYFEIATLTEDILSDFTTSGSNQVIHNVMFYKVLDTSASTTVVLPTTASVSGSIIPSASVVPSIGKVNIAIPVKLWGTATQILVDDGNFVGQDRLTNQDVPTVYDLAIESEEISGGGIRFHLFINNVLVASVDDTSPLPSARDNVKFTTCLFTRGSSKVMFENIYALKNLRTSSNSTIITKNNGSSRNISDVFGNSDINASESLRKYSLSGLIQNSFLSSVSPESGPRYDIYMDEFGTIMRECSYFNIKYDQAYPALLAKIVPSFNNERSVIVSGFTPGSYGAEFMLFNATDKTINIAEGSTSRIAISGITFTQNISNVLTVDDYFSDVSNLSDPFVVDGVIRSPQRAEKTYQDIKNSRSMYGNRGFSLDSLYIQNEDSAREIMEWVMSKTLKNRKVVNLETFGTQYVQIGDIVKINYVLSNELDGVDPDKRFVVTNMGYTKSNGSITSTMTLVEI
jgi:hypothetical protein